MRSLNTTETHTLLKMKLINKAYNFIVSCFNRHFYYSTIIQTVEVKYSGMDYNLSIDEDETYLANGFLVHNCRSTTSPLFKEDVKVSGKKLTKLDQGGTRASIEGQVSADLDYNDWLKRQTKEFQVGVLGKQKAELFRKGDITMDKFVNNKGQELTLDQLKSKNPTAWSKAFD